MSRKGALFYLIKSLSRSEKRYFRLLAGKEDAIYQRLFTAIEKQEVCDEEAIRKQFKGEPFIRQLHVAKNYLTALIMRALRNYHARSSANAQVLELLRDAEILVARELYNHCHYALAKAEALAATYEYHPLLLETQQAKRRLELARGSGQGKLLTDALNTEREVIRKTAHLNKTWQLTTRLFEHIRNKDLLKSELLAKKPLHASIRSETLRRHMRYSWYFMNAQRSKAEKEVDALLSMLEKYPQYISEEPGPYVTALGNKISMLLGAKRWKETETLLGQMRKVPEAYKLKSNSRFTLRLWLRLFNLELEYYREAGKTERSLKLVPEITAFISAHRSVVPLNYVLLFRFQFALVLFGAGNQRASLKEINEIINGDFGNERPDLQCSARLLNLVVHFELGNILVLRYIVDSTQRFLLKHKGLGAQEKILLNLFRKLSRAEKREYKQLFHSADEALTGEKGFEYFDFGGWIRERCS